MDLTERQQAVFDFLKSYRRRFRRSPSYEEIRRHFGFASLNSVRKHLQQLERKGYIRTPWANQKRAIELMADKVDPPPAAETIPLKGSIHGEGVLVWKGGTDTVTVPASLLTPGEHYALTVSGDGLEAEGLFAGDILVIRRCNAARAGQVVVALVGGKAVVKRMVAEGEQVALGSPRPGGSGNRPEALKRWPRSQMSFLGVCVALLRRYG